MMMNQTPPPPTTDQLDRLIDDAIRDATTTPPRSDEPNAVFDALWAHAERHHSTYGDDLFELMTDRATERNLI